MSSAASSQVRKMQDQMREMERQMQEKERQQAEARSRKKVGKEGDYIDYEELS
jgi:DNA-binding protein YbaB